MILVDGLIVARLGVAERSKDPGGAGYGASMAFKGGVSLVPASIRGDKERVLL